MITLVFMMLVFSGVAFYLAYTSYPDHSKYWEEKGRKEFAEELIKEHEEFLDGLKQQQFLQDQESRIIEKL